MGAIIPSTIKGTPGLTRVVQDSSWSVVGTSPHQVQSSSWGNLNTSRTDKLGYHKALTDIYALRVTLPTWQRDTTRSSFYGEMPIYNDFHAKVELVVIINGTKNYRRFTFGGLPHAVCTAENIVTSDPLNIHIPKGAIYDFKTTTFAPHAGVDKFSMPPLTIAGFGTGGSMHSGLYYTYYTYVFPDGSDSLPQIASLTSATNSLLSSGAAMSDGDIITINGTAYTAKTYPVASGHFCLHGTAATDLGSLVKAINGNGNLGVAGIASGAGTTTTINDTTKSWATNQWVGYQVFISAGTGNGQTRTIASNTATQLTLANTTTATDATSVYHISLNGGTIDSFTGTPADTNVIALPYASLSIAATVTLIAKVGGTVGNSLTLAKTGAATITLGGTTFSGGSANGTYTVATAAGAIVPILPANPNNGAIGVRFYTTPASPSQTDQFYGFASSVGMRPFNSVSAYQNPTILIDQATSAGWQYRKQCNFNLTSYQIPLGGGAGGGISIPNASYVENAQGTNDYINSSIDFSGPNFDQNPSVNTTGGYQPTCVEGLTNGVQASVYLIGDSRMNGVGTGGYGPSMGNGSFAVRAILNQTATLYYDATKTPLAAISSGASSGEQAAQFANPLTSWRRRQLAAKHTHLWCNYSINDIDFAIGTGSALLAQNVLNIANDLINAANTSPNDAQKTWIQSTIPPFVVSNDGFQTATNQSFSYDGVSKKVYAEGYRQANNSWLRNTGGALTITNEVPFMVKGSGDITPVTNATAFANADGTATYFIAKNVFLQSSFSATDNGSTIPGGSYTFIDNITINGSLYSSGIIITVAPTAGHAILFGYTSIPGFKSILTTLSGNSNVFIHDGCVGSEVDSTNAAVLNGGCFKAWSSTTLTTTTTGVGSATTAPLTAASIDLYRGQNIVDTTLSPMKQGGITHNSTTVCTVTGGWATPASGDTIKIGLGMTVDGTHYSDNGAVLDALQFPVSALAIPN